MTRVFQAWGVFPVCLAGLLLVGGCGEESGPGIMEQSRGGGPGGGGPGAGGPSSLAIKQIMGKLARGPQSLTPVIGSQLDQDPPPWETIQGQTKEYAQSASELGKYDPPKGAKESWIKLTTEFAKSASELDRAAGAKDKDAAKVAHEELKNSCNACHQEHRRMGRGGGGPPGFGPPGGGRRRAGKPPRADAPPDGPK